MEQIKVKCPNCKKILVVNLLPGIENKLLNCASCNLTSPFTNFQKITDDNSDKTIVNIPTDISYPDKHNVINLGSLVCLGRTTMTFDLTEGMNIIGRKTPNSSANIQIDTFPSKRMSRMHLCINVEKSDSRGYKHYLSLYKINTNPTLVNGTQILFGDTIILKHDDVIQLPDVKLKFILPDG